MSELGGNLKMVTMAPAACWLLGFCYELDLSRVRGSLSSFSFKGLVQWLSREASVQIPSTHINSRAWRGRSIIPTLGGGERQVPGVH